MIPVFSLNNNGDECGLWKYFADSTKINVYLHSTETKEDSTSNSSNEADEQQVLNSSHKSENLKIESIKSINKSLQYDDILKAFEAKKSNSLTSMTLENKTNSSSRVLDTDFENDNVQILYLKITYSRYTRQPMISHEDKNSIFNYMMMSSINFTEDIETFDPIDHGFMISKIIVRDKLYLETEVNEDQKINFKFPSADRLAEKHSIIHTKQEMQGKCNGTLGIGMLTNCYESFQPMYHWYKNGVSVNLENFNFG